MSNPKFNELSKGQKAAVGFTAFALAQYVISISVAVSHEVRQWRKARRQQG